MKKYIYTILFICCFGMGACNDDFMQQDSPLNPSEGNFLKTEAELELYLNNFYGRYIVGHQSGWASDGVNPFGYSGSPLMYGDFFSDNLVAESSKANDRLSGNFPVPIGTGGTSWGWGNLKQINYFLRNYKMALGSVDNPEKLDKWVAEAKFFKAWEYFNKVKIFGDVPWYEFDLNIDSPGLYDPRTPRAEVMDSVLACIDFAVDHLKDNNNPIGRVNQDMALFLKSRICLYEGTYRKYHKELNLDGTASKWIEESLKASDALIKKARYRLFTTGENSYWSLFAQDSKDIKNNPEVILARYYSTEDPSGGHAAQRYYEIGKSLSGRPAIGATKGLIDEYLCIDGQPIYSSYQDINNNVPNPLFLGYDGLWSELENRDPRLKQTVSKPGEFITVWSQSYPTIDPLFNGIRYPGIGYSAQETTVTGYRVIKHWMANKEQYDRTTLGTQAGIEFRYAEVLLNYIEAKAELGNATQEDINITINALRERAGFDFVKYPNSKLTLGNEPNDPRLDKIYADKLDYTVSKLIREIRRERRVEFASENQRYNDLMRWKAGPLMSVPLRGMKFTSEKQTLYDGLHRLPAGVKPPYDQVYHIAEKAVINQSVFLDADGFIIAYPKSTHFDNGIIPWEDYRYLWPLPKGEMIEGVNPNLQQNPGWDK